MIVAGHCLFDLLCMIYVFVAESYPDLHFDFRNGCLLMYVIREICSPRARDVFDSVYDYVLAKPFRGGAMPKHKGNQINLIHLDDFTDG